MTVVLDTSVLIDHLRGRAEAQQAMADAVRRGEVLAASVLCRTEILAGMRSTEEEATHALLAGLDWIPVTIDIADRAGAWARRFLRSHPGIDPVDYVIAATTATVGGRLWTCNVKHFPMFADLTAPY
ncbi:type II toxin-antitoxin system VapC family toxin [Nocardioides carbamazepini]|uniref:type II toxin-antitoxin system VapC family toxin n=1 Tax=Nocardioides carbamazepini TaxID=2854259 RepID=UPI002149D217|nr:type II toxin-antitoxin system VapC family toxin [Nocardioides carbamazepini]MCR1785203.1 type II toxin-antitoxin system VapC family toxin [Nocardioides carbamazepini]